MESEDGEETLGIWGVRNSMKQSPEKVGEQMQEGHIVATWSLVMNLKEVSMVICFLQIGSVAQMQARSKSMRFKQCSSGFCQRRTTKQHKSNRRAWQSKEMIGRNDWR